MIYNEGKRLNSSERFGKWILEKTGFERLHQQLYVFFADTIKKYNIGDPILNVIKETRKNIVTIPSQHLFGM